MAKKYYHVIADFVDKETKETVLAGTLFEADEKRHVALLAADVIGEAATKEEIEEAEKKVGEEDDANDGKSS